MMNRNDEGWILFSFLAGPLGVAAVLLAVLMIAVAVMM